MKRFDSLTHGEIVALTEEQIERFIEIEIAVEGIMPIVKPEVPTLESEGIVASEIAFRVGDLILKNEDDAIAVARMDQFMSKYDYRISYDYRWLEPITEKKIDRVMFYKQEDIVRIQEILQNNKTKKDEFDSRQKEYNGYMEKTGRIRNSIYETYYEAKRLEGEFAKARETLKKYVDLADGNEEIANGFFKNTYKDRQDIIKNVLGELNAV